MPESKKIPKILIVEDDNHTSQMLTSLLTERIPRDLQIHLAQTHQEAMSAVQQAVDSKSPYDIVLLDFLLPREYGASPEVNEGVFRTLRENLHDSVVIHLSAYSQEPALIKFILKEAMRSPFGPRSAFLNKRDGSWPRDLVKIVEEVISTHAANPASHDTNNFLSCFISYSHGDEEFVRLLYTHLRSRGLNVWFAPEDLKPGKKLKEEIDIAVRVYDKLLIVLSELSLGSDWVATEIRTAIDEERKTGVRKLFPIRLVDYASIKNWECFNSDVGKDMAVELREYYIPDFSNWRDEDDFAIAFEKLLAGMKT